MTRRPPKFSRFILFICIPLLLLPGCSISPVEQANSLSAQGDWMEAVMLYRKQLQVDPTNIEYRSRLKQTELRAADYYYQKGLRSLEEGDYEQAMEWYQQGLIAMPDHSKLRSAISEAIAIREANRLLSEAIQLKDAGRLQEALVLTEDALRTYPDHDGGYDLMFELKAKILKKSKHKIALTSLKPISLNFRNTPVRTAFDFVSKSFGLNIIYDEQVKGSPISITAKNITFEQALNLMLTTSKTFYKQLNDNTILIAPNTAEKHGQYDDYLIRTFQLNSFAAKDMAKMVKGLFKIKDVFVNEDLNTLYVRGTEEMMVLVENLVALNDRKPAEMILDVEILEVNRTKAEQLGFDWGSIISASYPPFSISGSISDAFKAGTVTLPSTTFRYFKQDVDAETLANPKIRVLNGKVAKIHIGDRVPLRASTIQDATGQIRTTFNYTDIGIKLTVEPTIHLDHSSTVKIDLEVSALGQNLGTIREPAFSIGTRNANTSMLLRDGETAILGGLIRDEDRNTMIGVPGLGEIPVVGNLFKSKDVSRNRTDILLTITPRLVRGWDKPTKSLREFYSGTKTDFSTKAKFAYMKKRPMLNGIEVDDTQMAMGDPATSQMTRKGPSSKDADDVPPFLAGSDRSVKTQPLLNFSKPIYEVKANEEFEVKLVGSKLHEIESLPIQVLYNSKMLEYLEGSGGEEVSSVDISKEQGKGVLKINLEVSSGGKEDQLSLASIKLRGTKPGVSYLVYRVMGLTNSDGKSINAQVRASRIIIR